jgi:hypothetical protein
MSKRTLDEWKSEYMAKEETKEKIEKMISAGVTQEQAEEFYSKNAELIYSLCHIQPMGIGDGESFNIIREYDLST